MSEHHEGAAAAALESLRRIVEGARSVPMSASCVVNRSEVLALIDQSSSAWSEELAAAKANASDDTREQALAKADEIIEAARQEARDLVDQSAVVRTAQERAEAIVAKATEDAVGLKVETDRYADARLAEFEADLQRTMGQVSTMRQRLSERSGLDASEVDALPSLDS